MLPKESASDGDRIATLGVIVMKSAGMMCLLSLIVVISVEFSFEKVTLCRTHPGSEARQDLLSCFSAWDGEHYVRIAREGYDWRPDRRSNVAFFPVYPALGAMIHRLTGCRAELALLCVSHAAFFGCFVVLSLYINDRFGPQSTDLQEYSLVALGLFPTTFWMRMCCTESLFLLIILLAMYGMRRDWHPLKVAMIIGLSTGTRAEGVVLVPVFCWWIWERHGRIRQMSDPGSASRDWIRELKRIALIAVSLVPVTLWGLLAYMGFLWVRFGDPLVFMQTQVHWNGRLISLRLANPAIGLVTVGLLGLGARKRWLNSHELLLSAGLLGIALWFQGAQTCIMSQPRSSSVIFPIYLVIGQILSRIPAPLASLLCSGSAVLLFFWTALFASWYFVD